MLFKLMLFSMLVIQISFAAEAEKVLNGYDPKTDIISENYEAGPYLIYDCEEKHYTCVMQIYFEECQKKQTEDLHYKKADLRCAPLGELPNKKSCFQKQLFMASQNHGTKFCVGPDWKSKRIEF